VCSAFFGRVFIVVEIGGCGFPKKIPHFVQAPGDLFVSAEKAAFIYRVLLPLSCHVAIGTAKSVRGYMVADLCFLSPQSLYSVGSFVFPSVEFHDPDSNKLTHIDLEIYLFKKFEWLGVILPEIGVPLNRKCPKLQILYNANLWVASLASISFAVARSSLFILR